MTGPTSVAAVPSAPTGGVFEAPDSQPRGVPVPNSFSPPPEPPPSRPYQPHPQDPFSDRHETLDTMQAPLEPQNYGVSASIRQENGSHAPTIYHTNFQPMSPYEDQHDFSVNHQPRLGATTTGSPVSPEEVRRPVQYRF